MDEFNGDLTPLANCPLQVIHMHSFKGDLTHLRGKGILLNGTEI